MLEFFKKRFRSVKAGVDRVLFEMRYWTSCEILEGNETEAIEDLLQEAPPPSSTATTQNNIEEEKYDLTIIIPAYNAEKWIRKCVDSVINQETDYKFWIWITDDGSTDKTGAILDSYLPNEKIHMVHQENRGYSGARNIALRKIFSRYVMFVDADDILLPGAIEDLLNAAYTFQADIVEGSVIAVREKNKLYDIKRKTEPRFKGQLIGAPWGKIIASKLFEHVQFPENYWYEDTIINTLICPQTEKVATISNDVYAYSVHPESITQTHDTNFKRVDSYWIMLLVHEDMKKLGISISLKSYQHTMGHIVFTYRRTVLLPENIKKNIFLGTRRFMKENYSKYMNSTNVDYLLAKAILDKDYKKYCLFCEWK